MATIAGVSAYAGEAAGPRIKETPVVTLPKENLKSISISPDNKQVAYLRQDPNSKKFIVSVNGKDEKPYDWVIPQSLTYSMDSTTVGYIAQDSKGMVAVVGGKESKSYYEIAGQQLQGIPSSGKFAWKAKARANGGFLIVNDFQEGNEFEDVSIPVFSTDGKHSVYRIKSLGMMNLVLNGKQLTPFDSIPDGSFSWNADSSRYAFVGVRGIDDNAEGVIFSDGKDLFKSKSVSLPVFSPDGKRLAFAAMNENKKFQLFIDGKPEGETHDRIIGETMRFSPDSKRIGFIAAKLADPTKPDSKSELYYVIDGVKSNPFEKMVAGTLLFSPDSKEAAYVVDTSKGNEPQKLQVIINNRGGESYDEIQGMQYSPDSRQLAFLAKRGVRTFVVIDNINGANYEAVASLQYSKDGKMLYVGRRDNNWYAVLDQVEGKGYMGINTNTACFSPDGKNIVYQAVKNAPATQPGNPETLDSVFVVNKTEVASFKDTLPGCRIIWDSDTKFRSLVLKDETQIVQLEVEVPR
jgi:dipeptidyl aminopeptidase/acylaminoacyl peptidase